jgi:hypothetical protein
MNRVGRRSDVGPLLTLLAVTLPAAVLLGAGVVSDPAVVIPLTFELVLLLGISWWVIHLEREPDLRRWLLRVVLLSLALRLGAVFLVHGALSQMFFAPDAASYYAHGLAIHEHWMGGAEPDLPNTWQVGYGYLNALFFLLFGDPVMGMVVLNVFAGLWLVILVFILARRCFDLPTARVAAVLTAVFPSLVLWSVINIRDILTALVVVAVVLLGVRAYERVRGAELVLLVAGALFLTTLRDYMGFLVIAGLLLGYVTAVRRGSIVPTFAAGTVLILFLVFGLGELGILEPEVLSSPLRSASRLRESLQGGGAVFGQGVDISTPGGALRYLPYGMAFFLLAPFPWAIASTLQLYALPEVLLWYALIPFTVMGFIDAVRRDRKRTFLLVGVLVVIVTSYALVEGNFGTAYRHRAQAMPLFFVFTGRGVARWWSAHLERRRGGKASRAGRRRPRGGAKAGVPGGGGRSPGGRGGAGGKRGAGTPAGR